MKELHWQFEWNKNHSVCDILKVSAKTGDGIEDLKRYLFSRAQPGEWVFTRNMITDQMPQEIAEMCVREKMLENMPEEIPYEVKLVFFIINCTLSYM